MRTSTWTSTLVCCSGSRSSTSASRGPTDAWRRISSGRLRASLVVGIAALGAANSACLTTNIINIGQKTSLEKQLMGEEEPLTEEEILASSVRAPGGSVPAGSADDLQSRVLSARRRQLFNRDDVDELKAAGCLGEGLKAKLTRRPCDADSDPETARLTERMVNEENEDRHAIIVWAIGIDQVLTSADRPQIEAIYHRLVVERARAGDWVQAKDGRWSRR